MKLDISQISYQRDQMHLILDDRGYCIEYREISYYSLDDLLATYPEFASEKNVKILALISNFLFGGLQYSLIEDIASFQGKYDQMILADTSKEALERFDLSQYGSFDIFSIKPPQLAGDVLTYFVESINFGIPYQATCVLPAKDRLSTCSYSLLPLSID